MSRTRRLKSVYLNFAILLIALVFGIIFLVSGILETDNLQITLGTIEILNGIIIFILVLFLRRLKNRIIADLESGVLNRYEIMSNPLQMKGQKVIDFFENLSEKHNLTAIILAISIILGLVTNIFGIIFIFQEFRTLGLILFLLPSVVAISILIAVLVVKKRKANHWYKLSPNEENHSYTN